MVDDEGHVVQPMRDIDDIRNGGGSLYPSHLDTILDPRPRRMVGRPVRSGPSAGDIPP
jgi:hypothetical protein